MSQNQIIGGISYAYTTPDGDVITGDDPNQTILFDVIPDDVADAEITDVEVEVAVEDEVDDDISTGNHDDNDDETFPDEIG